MRKYLVVLFFSLWLISILFVSRLGWNFRMTIEKGSSKAEGFPPAPIPAGILQERSASGNGWEMGGRG